MNGFLSAPTVWAIVLAAVFVVTARPRRPQRPLHELAPHDDDDADVDADTDGPRRPRVRRRRTTRDDAASTAHWCEALARSVRSGASLPAALSAVPPPSGCERTIDPLVRGLDRTGRFTIPARGVPSHLALALAVISATLSHGGPAAEPFDRAADVLRGRAAEHAERQVHSAQARLSAQVMSALPLTMLTLLLATSASVRAAVASPVGVTAVSAGAVLNVVGWRWMRHIVDRSVR